MFGENITNNLTENESDLKACLQNYLHANDVSENPLDLMSIDSPYVNIEDINDMLPNNTQYIYKSLHINIHSIPDKIDQLKEFLIQFQETNIQFDFILLCETFLKDDIAYLYNIPGYNLVSKNGKVKSKGGVAIDIYKRTQSVQNRI